jgi:hypothetical protein
MTNVGNGSVWDGSRKRQHNWESSSKNRTRRCNWSCLYGAGNRVSHRCYDLYAVGYRSPLCLKETPDDISENIHHHLIVFRIAKFRNIVEFPSSGGRMKQPNVTWSMVSEQFHQWQEVRAIPCFIISFDRETKRLLQLLLLLILTN